MKARKSTCEVLLYLGIVVLFLGCGAKHSPGVEQPETVSPEFLDRYDPLEFPRDLEIIPERNPVSGAVIGHPRTQAAADRTDATLQDSLPEVFVAVPDAVDTLNQQAYRVQIATTKLFGEARKAARIAREIFDRPVFVDYEVPYYKIRVGNFNSRDDAERYRRQVRGAGYGNAWVVAVTIDIQAPASLYDDMPDYLNEADSLPADSTFPGDPSPDD